MIDFNTVLESGKEKSKHKELYNYLEGEKRICRLVLARNLMVVPASIHSLHTTVVC